MWIFTEGSEGNQEGTRRIRLRQAAFVPQARDYGGPVGHALPCAPRNAHRSIETRRRLAQARYRIRFNPSTFQLFNYGEAIRIISVIRGKILSASLVAWPPNVRRIP
jgi:hypothetical protein